MPKSSPNPNSASRHSLRRNQVRFFASPRPLDLFILVFLEGLPHLPQTKAGMGYILHFTTQFTDLSLLRDVMPHVPTVQHASSMISFALARPSRSDIFVGNGTLCLAYLLHQDTRESSVCPSLHQSYHYPPPPPVVTPPNPSARMTQWRAYPWHPTPIPLKRSESWKSKSVRYSTIVHVRLILCPH